MQEKRRIVKSIFIVAIYELINILFVYKYTTHLTTYAWAVSLAYLTMVNLFILLLLKMPESRLSPLSQRIFYFATVVVFAVMLTSLMLQFNPQHIQVGRYFALHNWISKLFKAEFPYLSPERVSGFPFLFVIAIPFYLLGDLGLLQIFSFLTFSVLLHRKYHQDDINRFRVLLLLTAAPVFIYEIIVRSELFSNMVIILLYFAVFAAFKEKTSHTASTLLMGFCGGLLLSTRGVVLLIYIVVFVYYLKRQHFKNSLFFLSMLAGFLLTLAPFLIWDGRSFIRSGPFSIQLSYIPGWLLAGSILASLIAGWKVSSLQRAWIAVAFILFGLISTVFLLAVIKHGWEVAVLHDGFDISYFAFSLPFLLISLDFSQRYSGHLQTANMTSSS